MPSLTDPIVLELLGSAAVVLLMIGVAAMLGFRTSAKLSDEDLARLAQSEGASIAGAVIAANRKTALVRLGDGRVMVARVMGLDVSARIAPASAVRLQLKPGRLNAKFADIGFPPLHMRITDQPAWLAALASGGN